MQQDSVNDFQSSNSDHSSSISAESPDLGALLNAVSAKLGRHLVLPAHAADAIALWILLAYCHHAVYVSPILALISPERRCGKTTALGLVSGLVPNSIATANITSAALYRVIQNCSPTLLIDEADTFLDQDRVLPGILNAGHDRATAFVTRANPKLPDGIENISVWCPKVLAQIGRLPPTLEDRSIVIPLSRKAAGEAVERFLPHRDSESAQLAAGAASWAANNAGLIADAEPIVPKELGDRAADNWRQLLAIADIAGGGWGVRARSAAIASSRVEQEAPGELLLIDIKVIFRARSIDRITSVDLVAELAQLEHRLWPEWKYGQPIKPTQLAALLARYDIRPATHRFGSTTAKGYLLSQFRDAFARYTPSDT
jgi:putative DNA primase/helicase